MCRYIYIYIQYTQLFGIQNWTHTHISYMCVCCFLSLKNDGLLIQPEWGWTSWVNCLV